MSYQSTLRWYAENDPTDFENIIALVEKQASGAGNKLTGKNICLVVGHEPGGGAEGERAWNFTVAQIMAGKLEARGAEVFIYEHQARGYAQRCQEMRAGVLKHMPDADCILLLHYNSFSDTSAHGHEFHYRGSLALAEAMRDSWQSEYLWSQPRQNNGILLNRNGRGSKMIKLAPAACCLLEPFFESNPGERERLFSDTYGVAEAYIDGITTYLLQ